jgi:two-component system cell cycle response regulator
MGGRVLIIGGSAAVRIVLTARLRASGHSVTGVAEGRRGLACAAAGECDAVLIHPDLPDLAPDLGAADLVRRLRAAPAARNLPVLVVDAPGPERLRQAVLAAGADDVFGPPDETVLAARLRNLLRQSAVLAELGASAAPVEAFGFAEAAAEPAARADIVLVADRGEAAHRLLRDLSPRLHPPPRLQTRSEVLGEAPGGPMRSPDLYLIPTAPGDLDGALRLMAELRSRTHGRQAACCLLREADSVSGDAMAFDLGAADVIDPRADLQEMVLRLQRALARKQAADRLRASVRDGLRMAVRDPLTGLHNRRFAVGRLAALSQPAPDAATSLAVLIVDLDRFKRVNDEFGHAAGDAVLVEVARRLAAAVRPADLVARLGGEEFLVALPDTGLAQACAIAERLCEVVQAEPVALPAGGALRITASIGVAVAEIAPSGPAVPFQLLLDRADRALLAAKSSGRNQVTVARSAA